jgi:type II secretory pathway component PulM
MKVMEEIAEKWKDKKVRKVVLLVLAALVLAVACYFTFFQPEEQTATREMSTTETKLCAVLSDIEGVGKISAYVSEDKEGNPIGAVLILEGADSLSVRLDVMKATALALGIEQSAVQIYKMEA